MAPKQKKKRLKNGCKRSTLKGIDATPITWPYLKERRKRKLTRFHYRREDDRKNDI